jgi:hypothetical protein
MTYAQGVDEKGGKITLQDPMAAEFAAIDSARLVEGYLALERIFPQDLSRKAVLRDTIRKKVALLHEVGAAEAVRQTASRPSTGSRAHPDAGRTERRCCERSRVSEADILRRRRRSEGGRPQDQAMV